MDLAKEYREIAELTGRRCSVANTNILIHQHDKLGGFTDLETLDGLFQTWGKYCEPKGIIWTRNLQPEMRAWRDRSNETAIATLAATGNFHADFCRLLVAVLREINPTPERTKGEVTK